MSIITDGTDETYGKLLEWTSLFDVSKSLVELLEFNINLGLSFLSFLNLTGSGIKKRCVLNIDGPI